MTSHTERRDGVQCVASPDDLYKFVYPNLDKGVFNSRSLSGAPRLFRFFGTRAHLPGSSRVRSARVAALRRARARSLLTPSQSASRLLKRAAPPRRSAWQSAVAPPSTTPRPLRSAGRAPRASRRRRASACRCAGICAIERRFAAPSKRGAPRGNAAACSGGRGHSPPPRSGLGVIGTGRGRGGHACAAPFSSRCPRASRRSGLGRRRISYLVAIHLLLACTPRASVRHKVRAV